MITLSVLAAACAMVLASVPADRAVRRRLLASPGRRPRSRSPRLTLGLVATAAVLVGSALLFGTRGLAVAASVGIVAGTMAAVVGSSVRQSRAASSRTEVARACQVLARLVAAGQTPADALRTAAEDCAVLAESASMQQVGGNPVEVWRRSSTLPGHGGLVALARAWQVSHATGAPMAQPLGDVAAGLRADRMVANVVTAELAAPRATGRLLALLPFAGLALGYVIGSDPVRFLLDSWPGQLCLVVGVALACAGVLWVERLATRSGVTR